MLPSFARLALWKVAVESGCYVKEGLIRDQQGLVEPFKVFAHFYRQGDPTPIAKSTSKLNLAVAPSILTSVDRIDLRRCWKRARRV
jgi:hypothetical protein